jgi:hypothetical protein
MADRHFGRAAALHRFVSTCQESLDNEKVRVRDLERL